jgi:hypothetical protein
MIRHILYSVALPNAMLPARQFFFGTPDAKGILYAIGTRIIGTAIQQGGSAGMA